MNNSQDILRRAACGSVTLRPPVFTRILVLAPHPDDEAVGCGGYIAWANSQGADVTVVFVTNGENGAAPELRRKETRHAADILGIRRIVHWSLPDGAVSASSLPAGCLEAMISEAGAQVLLVPHVREAHPDHAAVAEIPLFFSGPANLVVMAYEVWTPMEPNCVIDISQWMDNKLRAIKAYESQCRRFNLESLATGLAQYRAAWSRMRSWRYAESFAVCSLAEYREHSHAS